MHTKEIAPYVRNLPTGHEYVTARNVHHLRAEVAGMIKRREVSRCSPYYLHTDGTVGVEVVRHRAPAPRWHRPAKIAAMVAPAVLGLGYAVSLIVREIAGAVSQAAPTLGAIATAGGILLLIALVRRAAGGRIVEGTFRARIR